MSTLSPRTIVLFIGAILLLAFGLRLYRAGAHGIFFDEKTTLLVSQGICVEGSNQRAVFTQPTFTPADFWRPKTIADYIEANTRSDIGNSPAYYVLLHGWLALFGLSDLSMRFLSVLFSTLIVGLLFIFVRRHFGSTTLALISAGIAAIEPFFVAYAQMARNYSMTFFLTLLATHLFLLICERSQAGRLASANEGSQRSSPGLHVAYGLVIMVSLLSHYLTVTVFLCHGLYALLYVRQPRTWLTLALTAAVGVGVVALWFVFGGGQYTFRTLAYQAEFYRTIALTNPVGTSFGTILPATIPNIAKRSLPLFTDLFMVTNGLGLVLTGLRNSALALGLGTLVVFIMYTYRHTPRPPKWVYGAIPVLLLAGLPLYTVVPLRLLVLSAAPAFVYLMGWAIVRHDDARTRPLLVMLLLLTFVPTFFLLFMAWRSGHTFGITQRYSGFSFPYVCILIAMGLRQFVRLPWWFSVPIGVVLLLQLGFVGQVITQIYAGNQPKYTYFDRPRLENPYWLLAQRLKQSYAPGDTIVYPGRKKRLSTDTDMDDNRLPYRVFDAQMVNIYLPPNALFVQRIDSTDYDRVVLVKGSTGKKQTVFDFEGTKYRY
ncbi:glycosyltransferase family 39 protein [Spirosoma arcticum]